jgi:SAM-dependent methyltransferase
MKPLEWRSERELVVDGVRFECSVDDYTRKTSRDRIVLLKSRGVLEQYEQVFAHQPPRNILEFGIFQGGSPALFAAWFNLEKFVGVDICDPVPAFDDFCRIHALGKRIRNHYRVSQTDRRRIEEIHRTEFGATPVDVIIDDASHHYGHTRRTFEIAFPLLRPGGIYVIEDWGWAHWSQSARFEHVYRGQTALSMLMMELLMLCASRSDLVSEVRVFPALAFIKKSPQAKPIGEFALEQLYLKRGIELVGTQHLHLGGVARLVMTRARRRLERTGQKLVNAMSRGRTRTSAS